MMKHKLMACALCVGIALTAVQAKAPAVGEVELLCLSYLRLLVSQQIPKQAVALAEGANSEILQEVQAIASRWMKKQIADIRDTMDDYFGDGARAKFESFVAGFTNAEGRNDKAYLEQLSQDLNLDDPQPESYQDLRMQLVGGRLQDAIEEGSDFLGEVQTWVDLKERKGDEVPSLFAWLTRNEVGASSSTLSSGGSVDVSDPLEEAEGDFEMVELDEDDFTSPLDAFDSSRKEKRDRKLAEAQAGMQQIAQERQTAEEEYAQKRLSAAQADADSMRRHAEELAAVEQQALEQRQRSWGNRLKSIVGTAAGSFGGAFLGGLGERAAEEAIDSVWQSN